LEVLGKLPASRRRQKSRLAMFRKEAENSYAALCWVGETLTGLDIDPARLMLAGRRTRVGRRS